MSEPSGPQWCPRFPGSTSPADLLPDFRDDVRAFISKMQDGGASVTISATFRPPERAYLMHFCCMIANGAADPETIPPMAGVDIDWTLGGDLEGARAAAAEMVKAYGIAFPAALVSRHTQRRAIDMTISWPDTLFMKDATGNPWTISTGPKTGMNPSLWAIGKTFGVVKLESDVPHWSDDGH